LFRIARRRRDLHLFDKIKKNGLQVSIMTDRLPVNEFCTDEDESCIYESLITVKPTLGDENEEHELYVRYKDRGVAEESHRRLVELFNNLTPDEIIHIVTIRKATIDSNKLENLIKKELGGLEAYIRY